MKKHKRITSLIIVGSTLMSSALNVNFCQAMEKSLPAQKNLVKKSTGLNELVTLWGNMYVQSRKNSEKKAIGDLSYDRTVHKISKKIYEKLVKILIHNHTAFDKKADMLQQSVNLTKKLCEIYGNNLNRCKECESLRKALIEANSFINNKLFENFKLDESKNKTENLEISKSFSIPKSNPLLNFKLSDNKNFSDNLNNKETEKIFENKFEINDNVQK